MRTRLTGLLLLAFAASCFKVTTVNIGQKTSLEKQLIGELEPLTEEELLVASVRAQGDIEAGSLEDLQARAIRAKKRQLFNRDDVMALKKVGCLGEGSAGKLAPRPCTQADKENLRERIISEENADRDAIIDFAIAADPVLTPKDRPQVTQLYRRMLLEQVQPGDFVQNDDGAWQQH